MNRKILYSVIVATAATLLIFFKFNIIPHYLAYDEVDFVRLALALDGNPYIPYSPIATGHATLYFYVILFSMKMCGISQFGLRLPSALFGVVGAVLFYLISAEVFNKKRLKLVVPIVGKLEIDMAFIVALLFVSMRWYFSFARFAFEASFLLTLELAALYAALLFRRNQSLLSIIIAALFSGLAYNSYTPGRIFVILILCILFMASKNKKVHIPLFLGVFGIVIAPLSIYLTHYPDIRISTQLYLANPDLSIGEKTSFFVQNIWKNIRMLFGEGDSNGRHNYPYKAALNPILFSFLFLGVIRVFRTFKESTHRIFVVYFLIGFLPTLLTSPYDNPNMLRTYTILPAIAYFVGQGLLLLYNQISKKDIKVHLVGSILVCLLFVSALYEIRTYFIFQKLVYEQAFDIKNGFTKIYQIMK